MNVIISNQASDALSSLNIDVLKKIRGTYTAAEIVSMFENFFYEKMIVDVTAIKDYTNVENIQNLAISLDANKLIVLLDGSMDTSSPEYISSLISMGIYNFTKNIEGVAYLISHPNSYKDVASMHHISAPRTNMTGALTGGVKVVGVKNITEHAGSTSFIYLLKNQLSNNYRVAAIEVDKRDFAFYNDKNMISTTNAELGKELLKLSGVADIVLIDLNGCNQEKACSEILYLLEPSTIKVNKLVVKNRGILKELNGKKIILNKSLLSPKDISEFEMEAGIKTYYSIPPVNDRLPSVAIDKLLMKLGFLKQRDEATMADNNGGNDGIFGLFRHKS